MKWMILVVLIVVLNMLVMVVEVPENLRGLVTIGGNALIFGWAFFGPEIGKKKDEK